MLEVELKARIDDAREVEERVGKLAKFVRRFDKRDAYWHGPEWRLARGAKGFRVRTDGDKAMVTFKTKRAEGGMELNLEREFEVSDADAFEALAERIGCERFIRKRKTGSAWEKDGTLIEIMEVEGLGAFIEIERLVDEDEPAAIALAQGMVRAALADSGVPPEAIESRTYSELLLAAGRGDR